MRAALDDPTHRRKALVPNGLMGTRDRRDQCPGVTRPWPATDGMLVRLRLIGGRISTSTLTALARVAADYGDGAIHPTNRANLQLRALPGAGTRLTPAARSSLEATGLLPSRSHELARNVMVSPQSGRAGGRTDLRVVAAKLDALICARPELAELPGKFLFVLDDGRGDLMDRWCDLGLVALDPGRVQLRVGAAWGPVLPVQHAATELAALASRFAARRGSGPDAPWHVAELDAPLTPCTPADPGLPDPAPPLRYGTVVGGQHLEVPSAGLDPDAVRTLAREAAEVIVTPWRGVLIPEKHD